MSFFSNIFHIGKFKNRGGNNFPLAFLEVDMHNHILPGIDDGSTSVENSLTLIEGMKDLGINKFVATPHILQGLYPNDKNSINRAHKLLQSHLDSQTKVFASAEHMIDEGLDKLILNNNLCVMPQKYVLIEMSFLAPSVSLFDVILNLQNIGCIPILAHPERYLYYKSDLSIYNKIKDAGCLLQLNLLAVSSYYGSEVQNTAQYLLKRGMYDFVGTDLHNEKHMNAIQRVCAKYDLRDIVKNCTIRNASLEI